VTVAEIAYSTEHHHSDLAGVLAIAGFAGTLVSFAAARGLYELRHAAFWAETAM
jgi:hypothetical protein